MEVLQNSLVSFIFHQFLAYFLLYIDQGKSVWLSAYCRKIRTILNDPLTVMGMDFSSKLCRSLKRSSVSVIKA